MKLYHGIIHFPLTVSCVLNFASQLITQVNNAQINYTTKASTVLFLLFLTEAIS